MRGIIFCSVISVFGGAAKRLFGLAIIAHFGVIYLKIQRGDERLLTVAEARQVKQFLRTNVNPQQEEKEESEDYATSILRNTERVRRARRSIYVCVC